MCDPVEAQVREIGCPRVSCGTQLGSPESKAPVGGETRIRIRFEAIWCLFGVCFSEALESTSETYETMETPLKSKKINELFSKSFNSRDLRYGVDENPSLSAIYLYNQQCM